MSTESQYDPDYLLDTLLDHLNLKNDAALARALDIPPPQISKIRHLKLPVGATFLIAAHEQTGMSIRDLRALMGDRREKFRAAGAGNGRATKREVVA